MPETSGGGPVRVAAVGLGWVTTHRHLPAMRRTGLFDLVGLVDGAPGRAQEVAARTGARRFTEARDLDAVDWLDEVEAVTIGTAPFSHCALVRAALERGKHVLTEKPFAMTPEEGAQMTALAAERGRVLAVMHNFQFARSALRLADDIARGRLGRITAVVGWQFGNPRRRLPTWYEELPFGLFYDESPHLFYLLRRFAPGPLGLERADAVPGTGGAVTPAAVRALYRAEGPDGPVPVELSMRFESPVSEWHLLVLGTEGLGDVDIFRDIYVRLPNDGAHTTWPVLRTTLAAVGQHLWQHLPSGWGHLTGRLLYGVDEVMRRFARGVREGAPPAAVGPDDAEAVLRMQHEVIRAASPTAGRG